MTDRAWIVEEQIVKGGDWWACSVWGTRELARAMARQMRQLGHRARVREYVPKESLQFRRWPERIAKAEARAKQGALL